MSHRHALILGAILVVGCQGDITRPDSPFLRGMITSRAPIRVGVAGGTGTRIDSIPAMLVDGRGIWPARMPCAAKARFAISNHTEVLYHGHPADTGQLRVGRRVSVWITGYILDACPPQATAARVTLEDGP